MSALATELQALDELAQALSSSLAISSDHDNHTVPGPGATAQTTPTLKIELGGGWWVDMTPGEATRWIERRKAAQPISGGSLLRTLSVNERRDDTSPATPRRGSSDESAVVEASAPSETGSSTTDRRAVSGTTATLASPSSVTAPSIALNQPASSFSSSSAPRSTSGPGASSPAPTSASPIVKPKRTFPKPGQSISRTVIDHSRLATASAPSEPQPTAPAPASTSDQPPLANPNSTLVPSAPFPSSPTSTLPSSSNSQKVTTLSKEQEKAKIMKALGDFMENQEALARASGSRGGLKNDEAPADALINEEGLPIHEIREDENGTLLSDKPEPTATLEDIPESTPAVDGYWSAAAVARREALRRKVFEESSDELDSDSDEEAEAEAEAGVEVDAESNGGVGAGKLAERPALVANNQAAHGTSAASTGIPVMMEEPPTPISPQSSTIPFSATHTDTTIDIAATPPNLESSPTNTSRRPSSSNGLAPKSILKPSARKKSVSFDESVPIPPDSPDADGGHVSTIGGMAFPSPSTVVNVKEEFTPRPVPVLAAPTPSKSKGVISPGSEAGGGGAMAAASGTATGGGFAGFKRGFLTSSSSSSSTSTKQAPQSVPTKTTTTTATTNANTSGSGKKPSLFAKRMAEQPTSTTEGSNSPQPMTPSGNTPAAMRSLPKMSEVKPNGPPTVKPGVIEKAGPAPTKRGVTTAGLANTVMERPVPVASGSGNLASGINSGGQGSDMAKDANSARLRTEVRQDGKGMYGVESHEDYDERDGDDEDDDDDDEDDDDDDDDFELELDEDEQDDYDLDDALLAREVALEYHRRQATSKFTSGSQERKRGTRNIDKAEAEDEGDMSEGEYRRTFPATESEEEREGRENKAGGGGEGVGAGVMLALPSISTSKLDGRGMPRIVNPTPDDLRKVVRVGKLQNGKLVLAPGERGWSDEEDEGDGESQAKVESGVPDAGAGAGAGARLSNREAMKRMLLGLDPLPPPPPTDSGTGPGLASGGTASSGVTLPGVHSASSGGRITKGVKEVREEDTSGLPPAVRPTVYSSVTPADRPNPDPSTQLDRAASTSTSGSDQIPKKVSRFKAARMGL